MEKYYPPKHGGVTALGAMILIALVLERIPHVISAIGPVFWVVAVGFAAACSPVYAKVWHPATRNYLVCGVVGYDLLVYWAGKNHLFAEVIWRWHRKTISDWQDRTPMMKFALGGWFNRTGICYSGKHHLSGLSTCLDDWDRAAAENLDGESTLMVDLLTDDIKDTGPINAEDLRCFIKHHQEKASKRPSQKCEAERESEVLFYRKDRAQTTLHAVILGILQDSPRDIIRTPGQIQMIAEQQAEVAV